MKQVNEKRKEHKKGKHKKEKMFITDIFWKQNKGQEINILKSEIQEGI